MLFLDLFCLLYAGANAAIFTAIRVALDASIILAVFI